MAAILRRPIVLFGPSGSGKSTLIKKLFAEFPNDFGFSVSHTTRSPREGEVDGVAYNFVKREEFLKMIENQEFIEHAQFSGNHYGSSIKAVEVVQKTGRTCILDIEIEGVKQVKKSNLNARFVFVSPPSIEILKLRLVGRNTETDDSLKKRLDAAIGEMEYGNSPGSHDIKIVNDDVDAAYKTLKEFIFES
ncbi:Guanylate kinase [Smittium culicis]|uniref:Guanylate kinase n=1 Tax=Smittium culicis TaxID=133412 RepID=A0A1R1YTQ2_9FUNG|nr:Guanylate kinase [Smittium culicis]